MQKQGTNKQQNYAAQQRRERPKFEDDRTPAVKKVDKVCKVIAVVLALICMANIHVVTHGGAFGSNQVVPIFGIAAAGLESDAMEPEIEAQSAVLVNTKAEYRTGDMVLYSKNEALSAGRITEISADGEEITVKGDGEAEATPVSKENISGKIIRTSKGMYGFLKEYMTVVGIGLTIILCFAVLLLPDVLMFRRRREALKQKREAYARKEARKLKVKQGLEQTEAAMDPKAAVASKRQAKIEKDRVEIQAEMKEIQKQMKEEEAELNLEMKKGGKKK